MRWLCGLLLFCVLLRPVSAQEDPGFSQTQLDAVFLVGDQSVRAMYSFSYIQSESMEEFRWLFPIPADVTHVELGAAYLPVLLQAQTDPIIEPPQQRCFLTHPMIYGHGTNPYVIYDAPESAQFTRLDSLEEAQDWLGDSPQDIATLDSYENFVGVTIQPQTAVATQDADFQIETAVNLSPVLVVDYPGTDIFLPVRLRAAHLRTELDNYSQNNLMPATAYIFADQPYAPVNYTAMMIDLHQIGSSHINVITEMMRNFYGSGMFPNELDYSYYEQVRRELGAVDGLGMVTEYRQLPDWSISQNTREHYPEATEIMDTLLANYPMLTRLRTFIHEGSTLPYPQFVPAPQAESLRLDLSTTADAAWFYGCTTRTLYNAELEARLPDGRTYIDALDVQVAHPADWSLSQLEDVTYVLAPEAVTLNMLIAVERGEDGPPMMVLRRFEQEFIQTDYGFELPDPTWNLFTLPGTLDPEQVTNRAAYTVYYPSTSWASPYRYEPLGTTEGVRLALISSEADFAENHAVYNDMLAYIATRQYWLSPDLRHTLFMNGPGDLVMVGYPENWIERLDENRLRVITPVKAADFEQAAYVREVVPPVRDNASAWIRDRYNLGEDANLATLLPFSANDRQGFIRKTDFHNQTVIEISAPEALYNDYAPILTTIAETLRVTVAP